MQKSLADLFSKVISCPKQSPERLAQRIDPRKLFTLPTPNEIYLYRIFATGIKNSAIFKERYIILLKIIYYPWADN